MMKFRLILLLTFFLLFIQNVNAAPFNASVKTRRIPAGTEFTLKMLSNINTSSSVQGMDFMAMLVSDKSSDTEVILPSGSVVRGTIRQIVPAKRLSKGAVLYLSFDHVVTPNGRQIPLSFSITGRSDLTFDGGITTTKNYGDALKQNWSNTVDITKTATNWGNETFEDFAGGYFRILTVPLSATGGALGGFGYLLGDSVADIFKKGQDVWLCNGEVIKVILTKPIDVPVL